MSRRLALAVATSCLLALLVPCLWGSEAEEKAQKAFDALYGADVKRALASRDTAQAVALAAKLLDSTKAAEDQPELMVLLCTKACELGSTDPQGYETVQAATDLVAEKTPEAAGPCQEVLATLRQREYDTSRGGAKAEAGEALIDALLALAATHTQAGKVEEAGKPFYKALGVAKAIKSSRIEAIDAQVKAHADRQKNAAELAKLKRQVEADPANAKARDQLVLLLIVGFDNPAEAATYLTDASDAALRKFVPAAARPVADAPEMACLGLMDWYVALAATAGPAGKAAMYARAVQYGERFLELHTAKDMDRTRVELAVQKAQDEIAKLGGEASGQGRWIDLLRLIDPQQDAVAGRWEHRREGLCIAATEHSRIGSALSITGSYELEVRFRKAAGDDLAVVIPVGTAGVCLVLGGWGNTTSGLEMINGRNASQNETTVRPGGFDVGKVYTVSLRVTVEDDKAAIAVSVDGKPFTAWAGPWRSLAVNPMAWTLRSPNTIGLGAFRCSVVFLSARLKMLSGKAVPVRPADAKSPGGRPPGPTSGGQATGQSGLAGWTVRDCDPNVGPGRELEWGGRKNVLLTHPVNPITPCVLTRKIAVPAARKATLHIVVANDPRGDFDLIVRAGGKELLRKTVNVNNRAVSGNWLSEDVSLSAFAGTTVDVEILQQATGWFYEQAYWAEITVSSP